MCSWGSPMWLGTRREPGSAGAKPGGAGRGGGSVRTLQYSCLENPLDGGAWEATVHGVAKSRARLSDFTFTFHFHAMEKEMATHSSILARRIPWTEEPDGLQSMGWAAQVEIPLAVGGWSVPVVLPGVANVAGNPPGAPQGRGETWRRGAGWGVRSHAVTRAPPPAFPRNPRGRLG